MTRIFRGLVLYDDYDGYYLLWDTVQCSYAYYSKVYRPGQLIDADGEHVNQIHPDCYWMILE